MRQLALALLLLARAAAQAHPDDVALLAALGLPERGAGFVTDLPGALDAGTRAELEDLARRYQAGSGHDIAVVLLATLGGRPIEDVGRAIGRTWGLGRAELNDGAVLLLALQDRELRIEVGRGLEGELTDLVCGRLIDHVLVPRLREGDLAGAVSEGLRLLHAAAGGEYGELPDAPPADAVLATVLPLLVLLFFAWLMARGGRRRRSAFPFPPGFPGGLRAGRGFGGLGGFGGGGFGGRGGGFGGFGGGGFGGGGAGRSW